MANDIRVRAISSSKELMQFIKFPWKIYKDDPHWGPHLIMDRKKFLNREKNPFFKENPTEFYLAYRNGEIVGRIAAILNHRHNEFHKDKAGFFGFLEAVNDKAVFEALLNTAKDWLREKGRDKILGPMNPSTNDEVGFLLENFDAPPYFLMTHTPPYYIEIMEALGYQKAKDLYTYYLDQDTSVITPKMERVEKVLMKKFQVKIRSVNLKDFNNELEIVREIYNDAWAPNWGFVPMTREEFDFVADDFKKIADPNITLIGEYKGEPIGFALVMPNYNEVFSKIRNGKLLPFGLFKFLWYKRKINSVRIIILGTKREYQKLGLGALFYAETMRRCKAQNYFHGEMSWILEDNELMNKAAVMMGGEIYKKYRIYEMAL